MLRVFKSNKGKFRTLDECLDLWQNAGINELCSLNDYLTNQYTEIKEGMTVIYDKTGWKGVVSGFTDDGIVIDIRNPERGLDIIDMSQINHMIEILTY